MSEHEVDAVVERVRPLIRAWRLAAEKGEAVSLEPDPDAALIKLCLSLLRPSDHLPGGLVCVPEEPLKAVMSAVFEIVVSAGEEQP